MRKSHAESEESFSVGESLSVRVTLRAGSYARVTWIARGQLECERRFETEPQGDAVCATLQPCSSAEASPSLADG